MERLSDDAVAFFIDWYDLTKRKFAPKKWNPSDYTPRWDHDHCQACGRKIWNKPQNEEGSTDFGWASHESDISKEIWFCNDRFLRIRDRLESQVGPMTAEEPPHA